MSYDISIETIGTELLFSNASWVLSCVSSLSVRLTHWDRDKMAAIFQTTLSRQRVFLNEIFWLFMQISLKFVPHGPISSIPALVPIMAWRRPGDKPLSEPMMASLLTHICIAQPQRVNGDTVMISDMFIMTWKRFLHHWTLASESIVHRRIPFTTSM